MASTVLTFHLNQFLLFDDICEILLLHFPLVLGLSHVCDGFRDPHHVLLVRRSEGRASNEGCLRVLERLGTLSANTHKSTRTDSGIDTVLTVSSFFPRICPGDWKLIRNMLWSPSSVKLTFLMVEIWNGVMKPLIGRMMVDFASSTKICCFVAKVGRVSVSVE